MGTSKGKKQLVLIADDSDMNRSVLSDMLEDDYEILEATNGSQAVSLMAQYGAKISILLLDIVMPDMDGFEVLQLMQKNRWIDDIPVIMISAEMSPSYMEYAYELGVADYISRPFDSLVVRRRVVNTIMLYTK
jgi:putative two-component system response regulator